MPECLRAVVPHLRHMLAKRLDLKKELIAVRERPMQYPTLFKDVTQWESNQKGTPSI
jgi:hypothetical protein